MQSVFFFFNLFGSSAVNTLHWQVEAHLSKNLCLSLCSLYISRTVHPVCFIPTATPALVIPNKVLANLRFSVNFSINPLPLLFSVQHFECAIFKKAACSVTRGQEIQQTQAPHWYNIKRKWTKWATPWKTMWNMLRIGNVHTIIYKNHVKMLWRDRSFKSCRDPHVSVDLAGSHQENSLLFFVHLPAFVNSWCSLSSACWLWICATTAL